MGRLVRWAAVWVVAAGAAGGCSWAGRPYADDPLLPDGRGVRGDPTRAKLPPPEPPPEPAAPPAPPGHDELIAAAALTSPRSG
jgi:hypothetical protein